MKHIKRLCYLAVAIFAFYAFQVDYTSEAGAVEKVSEGIFEADFWNAIIADSINEKAIALRVDGEEVESASRKLYMDDTMTLMVSLPLLQEGLDCTANIYEEELHIEKKERLVRYETDVVKDDSGQIYLPIQEVAEVFGYEYEWSAEDNEAQVTSTEDTVTELPARYDYRDTGRKAVTRDQGNFGTCWAFASLTALESTLLPGESLVFSADHMSINNSFGLSQADGGEYTMSIAYLTAWQGPVLEEDDPYGDGVSPDDLEAVRHVQEVQIIDDKDYEEMKKAVYKYGGVQTSIYNSLMNSFSTSAEYNKQARAYCYIGENDPNHEVVIIGWDDTYPKGNFNGNVSEDGAFICLNSWGDSFGDNGVFYISYEDGVIGMNSVVYTGVEDTDNYQNLYQSDLSGWTGQLGYNTETAYFANVYTAETQEELAAVGFYATGQHTEYKVSVVSQFEDQDSLRNAVLVAEGKVKNKGFYTIEFDEKITVAEGEKFAVVVEIMTPDTIYPVAVEYDGADIQKEIDLSDGEGYISSNGIHWENTEKKYSCNICLKVYTN